MTQAEIDQKFTEELGEKQDAWSTIKPSSEPKFIRHEFLWGLIGYSVETDNSLLARAKARINKLDELHHEWDQRMTFQRLFRGAIDSLGIEGEDRRFANEAEYFLYQRADEFHNQRFDLQEKRVLRQRRFRIINQEVSWSDKN